MIHELKTLPHFFSDVINGEKTFEIRKNDRDFGKGDLLALNEFDGQHYTGNSCLVYIDYILDDPDYVKKDMIVMAIKPCEVLCLDVLYDRLGSVRDYSVPFATRGDMEKGGNSKGG